MRFLPFEPSLKRAFTLIELLVVVGIMGALAAFVLPSLNHFGQSQSLVAAADQIVSDIKKTQGNALNGDKSLCAQAAQLRGWYIYFSKSDANGNYYQLKSSCYNTTTKVWNDLPGTSCPDNSNPIYLPKDIASVSTVIKGGGNYVSTSGIGSIMFYSNGSGRSPDPSVSPAPPGYIDMFVRECVSQSAIIVNDYPTLSPVAQNAKAIITLTPKSGNPLLITVCNNGATKIADVEYMGC